MNKNKADIYRAMVDMSSRDVQHDAFKYIKRWWKNGKWNYENKDESKAKSVINDSAATVKNALPERPLFDALSNVKWKTKAMSIAEDAATVNPNYDPKNPEYRENCSYCTIAYDLRRRGYDVEAKPTVPEDKEVKDDDLNIIEIMDLYKGGSIDDIRTWGEIAKEKGISKDNVDHEKAWDLISNDMTKYPDGARGHFALNWKCGGGHDIAWEKVDGKITFVDAQTNKITTQEDFLEDYILRCSNFYYMRTDHLKPSKEMLKYVKSK